jgi:hypothetical protein
MASTIVTRTISAAQENAISMANSQWARTLSIGTTWNVLRVGLRLHMGTTGANITGTPRFFVGLSSGTSNIFGDATTTHAVGMVTTIATWQDLGNGYYDPTFFSPAKRVNTTLTTGTTFGQSVIPAPASNANRTLCFIDITKGSPNFSFKHFCQSTGTTTDVSKATFLAQMEASTPSLAQHAYYGPQTLAVDEATNGFLDSVCVAWDRAAAAIEICDIAVTRFS